MVLKFVFALIVSFSVMFVLALGTGAYLSKQRTECYQESLQAKGEVIDCPKPYQWENKIEGDVSMKVSELIAKLQEMEQDAEVMLYAPPDYNCCAYDESWYAATKLSSVDNEVRIE